MSFGFLALRCRMLWTRAKQPLSFLRRKGWGTILRAASPAAHTARPEPLRSMPPICRRLPTKRHHSQVVRRPVPGSSASSALDTTTSSRRGNSGLCATSNPILRASCPAAQDGYHHPQRPHPKQIPPRLFSVEKTRNLPFCPTSRQQYTTCQSARTTIPTPPR